MEKIISLAAHLWNDYLKDNLGIILPGLAVAAAAIFVIKHLGNRKAPASLDPLERQAIKREGRTRRNERARILEFEYRNIGLQLVLCEKEPKSTRVNIDIRSFVNLLMNISPDLKTENAEMKKFVTDSVDFDSVFGVIVNDKGFAEKFLTKDIRRLLLECERVFGFFTLSIADSLLSLEIKQLMEQEADFDRLLNTALLLCDRIKYVQKALL